MERLIIALLEIVNEILAAGIVIIATSLLLYNLSRNLTNRVARASGIVLASVTFAYVVDVFLSLGPSPDTALVAARLQWIAIAFMPAALFHLSDALLATTGLPSRGRRRAVVRILYLISALFIIGATLTDNIAIPTYVAGAIRMRPQPYLIVYITFFLMACITTFINVQRARKRCLTERSARRMSLLQMTILMPAIGIFPYSTLLPASEDLSLVIQVLVNTANIIVITMLLFLSYPLSFFGSDRPDRVVKVELLRFLLRGPGTGLLALAVIITSGRATEIIGLPSDIFSPFAVVAVILFWQWSIHLALPILESWLVYRNEDDEQISKLQDLSDRILTRSDLNQLIEATLETICDFLRSENAFVLIFTNEHLELIEQVGIDEIDEDQVQEAYQTIQELALGADRVGYRSAFQAWEAHQLAPLYSRRIPDDEAVNVPIGAIGIRLEYNPNQVIDSEDMDLLYTYIQRTEHTLDDMILQDEIFGALEGLLPQFAMNRPRADELEYKRTPYMPSVPEIASRNDIYEQVRAALRHYWGGPGITHSRLFELQVVQREIERADSPAQALRSIIQAALERLRPEGQRSMTAVEWTLYNILELRFVEGRKVRDVARRMSLSEPDLYRKQRLAIESIVDSIISMEKELSEPS